jgi:RES domain-containing protein
LVRAFEEHPEFSRLISAMRRLRADGRGMRLDATAFRAAHPRYAQMPDLVSGVGAMVHGSRWNAPGVLTVLHAAMSPEGALAEVMAGRRKYGLPDKLALPLVLRGIGIRLTRVLDLCDGGVRVSLRMSEDRLVGADWEAENRAGREAVTQAVGRAAAEAGFEGLVVPSAADPGARNVVVFVDRLEGGSRVVLDEAN